MRVNRSKLGQAKSTQQAKPAQQSKAQPPRQAAVEQPKSKGWGPHSKTSASSSNGAANSTLENTFRRSNNLQNAPSASVHDRRHVMFGKTTSRVSETTLNSAENTFLKTLSNKGDKGFPKEFTQAKTLQREFDGFHQHQTKAAESIRGKQSKNVSHILNKLDAKGSNVGAVNTELQSYFQKEGLRGFSDTKASGFAGVADRALAKDPKNFAANYKREVMGELSRQSRPLTRQESLTDFKAALGNVQQLSEQTGKSPLELLSGSGSFNYSSVAQKPSATSSALAAALANVK